MGVLVLFIAGAASGVAAIWLGLLASGATRAGAAWLVRHGPESWTRSPGDLGLAALLLAVAAAACLFAATAKRDL